MTMPVLATVVAHGVVVVVPADDAFVAVIPRDVVDHDVDAVHRSTPRNMPSALIE